MLCAFRIACTVAVLCLLSVSHPLTANLEKPVNEPHENTPFPLGIADPVTQLAFVSTSEGIQGLNLDDGRTVWTYAHGGIPVFAESGTLTALSISPDGDGLAVVFINCADGKPVSRAQPFRVSSVDARALLQSKQPPNAKIHAREIYFTWPRKGIYTGGANPPPSETGAISNQYIAQAKISLPSGESEFVGAQPLSQVIGQRKDDQILVERGSELRYGPWRTSSGIEADLIGQSVAGETMIVLKLKKQDSASTSVTLRHAGNRRPYVTMDGEFLMLFAEDNLPSGKKASVFSVSTGSLVSTINGISTFEGTSVIGSRIYYQGAAEDSNVEINAAVLTSGKIAWRRAFGVRKPPSRKLLP